MKAKIKIGILTTIVIVSAKIAVKAQGWTASSPYVYTTTGTDKVGIGTTTPAWGLQIKNIINAGSISSGGTFGVGLNINDATTLGLDAAKHAIFGNNNANKDLYFVTYNGSSFDERMRIMYNGNVGIGTSAPTNAKLEVVHAGGVHARFAYDSDRFIEIIGNGNIRLRSTDVQTNPLNIIKEGLGDMLFKTGLNGSTATRMVIMQGGNVGVGTTTPASKLDVEGGMSVGASYSGTTAAPTNGAIIEGNVGIGTNSPAYKLDVVSTASLAAIRGLNNSSSTATGGSFYAASSGTSNYALVAGTTGGATFN